jgi:hypothetical protein
MKRTRWAAIRHIDWGLPVLMAILGVVLFFVWNIIKSGESGPELPQTHLLGSCMTYAGWACLALFPIFLWRAVEDARNA